MLTAGSFFQAEKGCPTQLPLWNYGENEPGEQLHYEQSCCFFFLQFKRYRIGETTPMIPIRKQNAKNIQDQSNNDKDGENLDPPYKYFSMQFALIGHNLTI